MRGYRVRDYRCRENLPVSYYAPLHEFVVLDVKCVNITPWFTVVLL